MTLSFQVEDVKEIDNVQKVLLSRINEIPQSMFSSAESQVNNDVIEFVIHGGAPSKELIKETVLIPGIMLFKSETGRVIISNQDIEDAVSGLSDDQYAVYITLNENGEKIMHSWSSQNIGKIMLVEYDGIEIVGLRIIEPLGKRFMVSGNFEPNLSRKLAIYLRTGALSSKVNLIE